MYYKDLGVWVPDEEILGIKFLKHEKFYVYQFKGLPYIIAAEVSVTKELVGFGADGKIYILEPENNIVRYAASALAVFARELKKYRDLPEENASEDGEEPHEIVENFVEEIKKLDEDAFSSEDNFWALIVEQMNDDLL